jgi:hypothetical protein
LSCELFWRRGRGGGRLGVVLGRGRRLGGRLSLRRSVGWFWCMGLGPGIFCPVEISRVLMWTLRCNGHRAILSVCLDCDCDVVYEILKSGLQSGRPIFGRGHCVCGIEVILISSPGFVSVVVDVSGVLNLLYLFSLLDLGSSGLSSSDVSLFCCLHPSPVDLVYPTQITHLSNGLLALLLCAVSSDHLHHDSQHRLCFFSHHFQVLSVSPLYPLSLSLTKLNCGYQHL